MLVIYPRTEEGFAGGLGRGLGQAFETWAKERIRRQRSKEGLKNELLLSILGGTEKGPHVDLSKYRTVGEVLDAVEAGTLQIAPGRQKVTMSDLDAAMLTGILSGAADEEMIEAYKRAKRIIKGGSETAADKKMEYWNQYQKGDISFDEYLNKVRALEGKLPLEKEEERKVRSRVRAMANLQPLIEKIEAGKATAREIAKINAELSKASELLRREVLKKRVLGRVVTSKERVKFLTDAVKLLDWAAIVAEKTGDTTVFKSIQEIFDLARDVYGLKNLAITGKFGAGEGYPKLDVDLKVPELTLPEGWDRID